VGGTAVLMPGSALNLKSMIEVWVIVSPEPGTKVPVIVTGVLIGTVRVTPGPAPASMVTVGAAVVTGALTGTVT
jgi:hypothetical protein